MSPADYYSPKYEIARHRFRAAASVLNAQQEQHAICVESCPGENLSIDVAWIGSDDPEWTVVVSSGLHGVEGFFGSAVQLSWLTHFAAKGALADNGRIVFIHAINPYGFRFIRRVNEDNTDLNRNFKLPTQSYQGRPDGYDSLQSFINPQSPPCILDTFRLRSSWYLARYGLPALKASIVTGQYDYPQGVFFGGQAPALSSCVIQTNYKRWVGRSEKVIHLDLHTGLGKFGTHKLLLADAANAAHLSRCQHQFGQDSIELTLDEKGTSYRSNGTMGQWLCHHLRDIDYTHFVAEFGTYTEAKNLGVVCADNRAHLYGRPGTLAFGRVKSKLMECFCPASKKWRATCLNQGVDLVDRCIHAANGADPGQDTTVS